jgi:7-cyano-7-deazaguanine reductase
MTGHPDFADITVRYVADKTCVELKSLKLYFHAYPQRGHLLRGGHEQDLRRPRQGAEAAELTIIADWKARGGFSSRITAEWTAKRKK